MGAALCLLGCNTTSDDRPLPRPTPTSPPSTNSTPKPASGSFLDEIVQRVAKKRGWNLTNAGKNEDKHKAFFVLKRTEAVALKQPAWVSGDEAGKAALVARLEAEIARVEDYLGVKLAPDQLGGAAESGTSPPGPKAELFVPDKNKHLNLADAAFPMHTTRDAEANRRRAGLVAMRIRQVRAIVWRGAAIHPELWDDVSNPAVVTFHTALMDTMLDRRLRPLERMSTQVANHAHLRGLYHPNAAKFVPAPSVVPLDQQQPGAAWFDGFRVRPFEYPRLPLSPKSRSGIYAPNAIAVIGSSNIADTDAEPWEEGGQEWRESQVSNRLEYNVPPDPGIQQRVDVKARWNQRSKTEEITLYPRPIVQYPGQAPRDPTLYDINLNPFAGQPGQSVDVLLTTQRDWWDRTWVYCDHVLSALNVEALLFSLRRPPNPGNDTIFDGLAARTQQVPGQPIRNDYVQLTHHLDLPIKPASGGKIRNVMMAGELGYDDDPANDDDPYFNNFQIKLGDLEVGDELAMFNSFVYEYISGDEWRFEYSFVMDIVSDFRAESSGVVVDKLMLIGHGIEGRVYADYQQRISTHFAEALIPLQNRARSETGNRFAYGGHQTPVVKWDPYNEFPGAPAPWWIVMGFAHRRDEWPTPAVAKLSVAGSMLIEDFTSPTTPFPFTLPQAVLLFPLFEPALPNSRQPWEDYRTRRTQSGFRVPKLRPVRVDGRLMPGIFVRGDSKNLRVIQPKVRLA